MKYLTLISSLILFEIAIAIALFYTTPAALIVFTIAVITYSVWLGIGKIKPYKNSPYSHMPNWFIYRRSWRIKFALSCLIMFIVFLQLDMGFVAVGKWWAGEGSFSWIAGSAVIIIFLYLIKDFIANKKGY